MPRGRKRHPLNITIRPADNPKWQSRKEAWAVVGPVLARILAKAMKPTIESKPPANPPSSPANEPLGNE